jgi:uncharacterized protein (DUF924 family)
LRLPGLGAISFPTAGTQANDAIPKHFSGAELPSEAAVVVDFWRRAGSNLWFAQDEDFDCRFRDGFMGLHEAATRGELSGWCASPVGSLALIILLDQFPRNAFRGSPRMYATDSIARKVAHAAIMAGHDQAFDSDLRLFFYLPFGHSEALADQARSVALCQHLGEPDFSHAKRHCDIIRRFGRFPHRNPTLKRAMSRESVYRTSDIVPKGTAPRLASWAASGKKQHCKIIKDQRQTSNGVRGAPRPDL